mmetsp:Transcript_787/g.1951  ORF Transcript_787/g.1951 Transcript_787/m.1951 type:complete len:126 (-) Transcript_787:2206-2583(-)
MVWVICLFSYRAKCGTCNGKQLVECALCRGSGVAKKRTRGNAPLNDITATTVLNTKWTAVESQRGQRHFVCVGKTGSGSKGTAQLTSLIGGENFSVTIEVKNGSSFRFFQNPSEMSAILTAAHSR